jgi:hypothetical protein
MRMDNRGIAVGNHLSQLLPFLAERINGASSGAVSSWDNVESQPIST